MKITFEEVLSRNEWLHSELLNSLTGELIDKTTKDQFYDVKLLVNGIELEPELFNKIMNNIEKFIENQAKSYLKEKLDEAQDKIAKLSQTIDEVSSNIRDEYKLDQYE